LNFPENSSIGEIKKEISRKFHGNPPITVQRIFSNLNLLNDSVLLNELPKDSAGRVNLIIDMPPPTDPLTFDPSNVIPSTRESQVESFCACSAALIEFTNASKRAIFGSKSPFEDENNSSDMRCSIDMQKYMQKFTEYLHKNFVPPKSKDGLKDGENPVPALPPFGPLHEPLRSFAFQCDIDWKNTLMMTLFLGLCIKFGPFSKALNVRRITVAFLLFFAQLRPTKFAFKIVYNKIKELPILTDLVVALLPATDQVLLQLDERKYVRNLYGENGIDFHPQFVKFMEENEAEELC